MTIPSRASGIQIGLLDAAEADEIPFDNIPRVL